MALKTIGFVYLEKYPNRVYISYIDKHRLFIGIVLTPYGR